ncbi:hypothetical protein OESDEN_12636, partial [Oesophagostomum dentatum]
LILETGVLKKLGLSESVGGKNGQIEQILKEGNSSLKFQVLPTLLLSLPLYQQCLSTVKEAIRSSDVCEVQSTLQPLGVPFEDPDLIEISEKIAASESELQCSGTHVFSDRIITKAIERLGDRIDSWAHELMTKLEQERRSTHRQQKTVEAENDWGETKKGGGKKKGKGGGGKGGKSSGASREESAPTFVGTLEEWIASTSVVPEEILEDVVERVGTQIDDKIRERLAEIVAAQQNAAAQSQKKSLAQLQQKAQSLYASMCTFEAASSSFPD